MPTMILTNPRNMSTYELIHGLSDLIYVHVLASEFGDDWETIRGLIDELERRESLGVLVDESQETSSAGNPAFKEDLLTGIPGDDATESLLDPVGESPDEDVRRY